MRSRLSLLLTLAMIAAVLSLGAAPAGGASSACGDPYTPIYDMQGAGSATPLPEWAYYTTEGVVVADFQMSSQLSGFFVQDATGDGDSATSDGIFVYHRNSWGFDVEVGQHVRFDARLQERYGQTQLDNVDALVVCGEDTILPTKVILPVESLDEWEAVEGMLVEMPQKLHVSGNYNQGYVGEVDLSFNWPLDTPTNVVQPGAEASSLADANDLSRIQLEDGSRWTNYNLPYFYDEDGYRTLRTGDTTKQPLTGAIAYDYGAYELHPTEPLEFQRHNPRPDGPPNVKGDLTVASFNVLNYFTTIDSGPDICGPGGDQDCRGADSTIEYNRQLAKILTALVGLDADVIGLQEVENNPAHVPIETLVAELNAADLKTNSWTWVGPVNPYNNYVIRNEIIYRADRVSQVGGPLTVSDYAFNEVHPDPSRIDPLGRPPIAQTFEADGEQFTVIVNHLKSKSCSGFGHNGGLDDDQGDGQGCWNEQRRLQALVTVAFIADLMVADSDVLVIGDLNSYAMEDPVAVFTDAGHVDLIEVFNGSGWKNGAYSYNYYSQSGYLDHALASASMASQIKGAAFWHINADEPNGLNYNTYNESELYSPDEFRSSDHDPVLIGLRLRG